MEGESGYATMNPHNFWPIFMAEKLTESLWATNLKDSMLRTILVMDEEQLRTNIRNSLRSDLIAATRLDEVLADPQGKPRWSVDDTGLLRLDNQIYVPDVQDLRLRVLQYRHDHPVSGHFGLNRTLDLIRRDYTWPGLRTFVAEYINSCTNCGRSKVPRHKPYGLLQQLPIPEKPWNSISMDFIEQLPESRGFTSVLVVVDRLSKQGIFIPTHDTITSLDLAKLFVTHVFSKHGVPSHVTSDWGPEFVSHFFRSLGKALDMKLHFSSGYHPEADRQTERTNQTLEQYLRAYCNYQQDNWSELLPLTEFAYNNTPSATTRITSFFANKGFHPNLSVSISRTFSSARAKDFAVDLDKLHQELQVHIAAAQEQMQKYADWKRLPAPKIRPRQCVFIHADYF